MKKQNRFQDNLRILRYRHKISQENLADDLGLTRARIGGWEEGRNEPNLDCIIHLADYFNISINTLIRKKLN